MRHLLIIVILVVISSCGTRRVETSKTRLGIIERAEWNRTAPGDRVYIAAPRYEPPRPNPDMPGRTYLHRPPDQEFGRDTTLRETGENGAVLTVRLQGEKFIDADCDCPDVQESGSEAREVDYSNKEKESEREAFPWPWIVAAAVVGIAAGMYLGWTTAMRRFLR